MNWSDKLVWKNCIVSTFLCLIGCSIGTMGILEYLTRFNFLSALIVSLMAGLLTSIIFITFWYVVFRKIDPREALIGSFKMSLVSMVIMMVTENAMMYFSHSRNMAGMQGMHHHSQNSLLIMGVAMGVGFLLALPYNYYQLQKNGKLCHPMPHSNT